MMLSQPEAALIDAQLPALRAYWQQYEFSAEQLKTIEENIRTYSVRLPLIGAFSAGKSTLINTLLQDNLLSVAIDPETSLPTEIRFAPQESITLRRKNGTLLSLSREALKAQAFGEHDPQNVVDITLPGATLAALDGMTLVDMPGWESGIAQHSLAIDNYLDRSAAYAVVVSVDEGVMKE
ncbi:dynamin family protein, partial [Leclercia adecarboxylata]